MKESFDVRSKANIVNAIRIIFIFILVCVATFFIFYLSVKVRYDSTEGIIIRTIAAGLALLIFVLYKPLFKKLVIKPLACSFDCHLDILSWKA